MKAWKKIAVLSLAVLALAGCTKSSVDIQESAQIEEGGDVDPAKLEDGDDDETLAREDNLLIEDSTEAEPLYDWNQVKDDADSVFSDTDLYPQAVRLEFTADESAMTIDLNWIVKSGTSSADAEEYASMLVKQFNDLVAVQSAELEDSSDSSFGTLWNSFALNVKVTDEGGKALVDKSYKAGDKIDLQNVAAETEAGPEIVEENVPKKEF